MNKTRNILIIVEGKRREREFFERLCGIFNIDYKIFTYETNIYSLYSEMKSYDFNADIIKVLKGLNKSSENSEIFENKFAFVYLVFDFEIQHNSVHGVFNKEQIE